VPRAVAVLARHREHGMLCAQPRELCVLADARPRRKCTHEPMAPRAFGSMMSVCATSPRTSQALLQRWQARSGDAASKGQVRCLIVFTSMHGRQFPIDEGIQRAEILMSDR